MITLANNTDKYYRMEHVRVKLYQNGQDINPGDARWELAYSAGPELSTAVEGHIDLHKQSSKELPDKYTVEFWIKLDFVEDDILYSVMDINDVTSRVPYMNLMIGNKQYYLNIHDPSLYRNWYTHKSYDFQNKWVHVAMTYDEEVSFNLYLNGKRVFAVETTKHFLTLPIYQVYYTLTGLKGLNRPNSVYMTNVRISRGIRFSEDFDLSEVNYPYAVAENERFKIDLPRAPITAKDVIFLYTAKVDPTSENEFKREYYCTADYDINPPFDYYGERFNLSETYPNIKNDNWSDYRYMTDNHSDDIGEKVSVLLFNLKEFYTLPERFTLEFWCKYKDCDVMVTIDKRHDLRPIEFSSDSTKLMLSFFQNSQTNENLLRVMSYNESAVFKKESYSKQLASYDGSEWNHVALTYNNDTGKLTIFYNGSNVKEIIYDEDSKLTKDSFKILFSDIDEAYSNIAGIRLSSTIRYPDIGFIVDRNPYPLEDDHIIRIDDPHEIQKSNIIFQYGINDPDTMREFYTSDNVKDPDTDEYTNRYEFYGMEIGLRDDIVKDDSKHDGWDVTSYKSFQNTKPGYTKGNLFIKLKEGQVGLPTFTFEFWYYTEVQNTTLLSIVDPDVTDLSAITSEEDSKLKLTINLAGSLADSLNNEAYDNVVGRWHHLALGYDDRKLSIFSDGDPVDVIEDPTGLIESSNFIFGGENNQNVLLAGIRYSRILQYDEDGFFIKRPYSLTEEKSTSTIYITNKQEVAAATTAHALFLYPIRSLTIDEPEQYAVTSTTSVITLSDKFSYIGRNIEFDNYYNSLDTMNSTKPESWEGIKAVMPIDMQDSYANITITPKNLNDENERANWPFMRTWTLEGWFYINKESMVNEVTELIRINNLSHRTAKLSGSSSYAYSYNSEIADIEENHIDAKFQLQYDKIKDAFNVNRTHGVNAAEQQFMAPSNFADNWNHIALTCNSGISLYSGNSYIIADTTTHISAINLYINGELINTWNYNIEPFVLFTISIGVPGTYTEKSYFTNIRFSDSIVYTNEDSFAGSDVEKRIPFL